MPQPDNLVEKPHQNLFLPQDKKYGHNDVGFPKKTWLDYTKS
jgi:hypothetical protein